MSVCSGRSVSVCSGGFCVCVFRRVLCLCVQVGLCLCVQAGFVSVCSGRSVSVCSGGFCVCVFRRVLCLCVQAGFVSVCSGGFCVCVCVCRCTTMLTYSSSTIYNARITETGSVRETGM